MTGELDYAQALAFIHGATGIGKKNGLENMRALLARLRNPQQQFPSVHIAGTNGKGSVCAFVHAGLVCAGKNTGLYTSPFLQRYNERIRINGVPVSDAALAAVASRIKREVDALRQENISPTEFEIGTAAAFLYFAQQQVDYAVVEVGLGGRLDPTNVLLPRICAIASIGLDHTHILGDTLEKIALEKAGIAKPGVPLVLSAQVQGEASEAIAAHCRAVGAPLLRAQPERDCPLGLPGDHQQYNAGVARAVLEELGTPREAILDGLRRTRWPARLEWLGEKPPLLLDGAHNPQGAQALRQYIASLPRRKTVLLCGILRDKDYSSIVRTLGEVCDTVVTVRPDSGRALDAEELAQAFSSIGTSAHSAPSVALGLRQALALAGETGRVVAAGSLYLAGEVRTLMKGRDDALLQAPQACREDDHGV